MAKKKAFSEWVQAARAVHGDKYEYLALDGKMLLARCPAHGEFSQRASAHVNRGSACPGCATAKRVSVLTSNKWSQEQFLTEAVKWHPQLDFSAAVYKGMLTPVVVTCRVCGGVSAPTPNNLKNGSGCRNCGHKRAGSKRATAYVQAVSNTLAARGGDVTSFTGAMRKMRFTCPTHGEYWQTAQTALAGHGCRKCADAASAVRYRMSREEFLARALEVHGPGFVYGELPRSKEYMDITCPAGHAFQQMPNSHLSGYGCPRCGQKSQHEQAIADWLTSLGEMVVRRERSVIAPKEIDIWLPERRIGVEFHGLYWHTESRVGGLHRDKWEMAQKAGVRLIQVFEDEWLTQQEIVNARLLALLGHAPKVFARKCELVTLAHTEAKAFLDATHIQGVGPAAGLVLGLRYAGELVAVATFGRSRSGAMVASGTRWEVLRYASSGTVVGGFGRLFAEFVRRCTPQEVVSYCDLRYGNGRLYEAVGFTLGGITEPDYWWLPANDTTARVSRYATQKHKLPAHPVLKEFYKDGMTEREVCAAAGWEKILGVGNQRWVWRP